MNYKVYKMNHLDDNCLPTDIDVLIFFSTIEARSWNIIEYFRSKGIWMMEKNHPILMQYVLQI